ncbi:MAG: pyrroline-5-carboxylate reductase [Eggerthellales bacterium]|nr:pyrroline-5-carboxylate reductase [Eggerthellales bacterium]
MAHDALTSVALVGGGKMGEAIMAGWLQATEGPAAELSPASFQVANPGAERQQYLRDTYGVACVDDASCLSAAQIVVLAVKPQVLPEVLPVVAQLPFLADSLVVSIAAGYTTSRIESFLPEGTHVVRVMPNTPLMVGSGASCLCAGSCATSEELHLAEKLFCSLGKAWVVEESALDAVCAVSGSGPAYVAALIEAMAEGAVRAGLPREFGEALATQTAYGTAKLMLVREQGAEKTRVDVCSPGGTTLAGLDAMNAAGFGEAVAKGVVAAYERSIELGKA